jgi:ABC-type enterochelin transport system ATPase subunit
MKDGRFCLDGQKANVLSDKNISGLFETTVHIKTEGGYYYATGF